MISLTLNCSSLSYSLHDQFNLHGAGSNHAGQLGVGGTADVQEPQVLQVCFWCQWSLLPFHLHQHPHWQMQGGSKRFVEGTANVSGRTAADCEAAGGSQHPRRSHAASLKAHCLVSGCDASCAHHLILAGCLQVVRHWAALSLGGSHAAGVSRDAECYTWGCNDLGQLGYSAGEAKHVPTKMDILRGWDVRAIACG